MSISAAAFRTYLQEVENNLRQGNATEHTHRPALKTLIQGLAPDVRAVNEPKRVECGSPDYVVTRNDLPVGYIEAKDVGRSLDEIEHDEQLKRYREGLSSLILTDYLEFRWYRDGERTATGRIANVGGVSGRLQRDSDGQAKVAAMMQAFLAQSPPIVGTPEDLAKRMAALARIVRDLVRQALEHDRSSSSPLREQLDGFRRVLIHDLNEAQFADMYAQTIAYGLFAARINAPPDEHFTRQHAAYDLPRTNPFLRQMFGQIAGPELDERITWAVDDLAELLARAHMEAVLANFGRRTRQEDPVVHFYETFLKAYDPKMRETRGVYYTPEPVVSYIVRSIDHILKTEFGLPDGLADNSMIEVPVPGKPKETRKVHRVQILDPACGTGTFLAQVIETIRGTVVARYGAGMWPGYVHDHLLPRLYGFELLMAPYAIAHLKLGLRLKETGYDIEQSERLRVYLTNSLEEAHEREHGQLTFFGAWLAEEADRASEVKRELPIMVILGNPPYSGQSANTGEWITQLLHGVESKSTETQADYFSVDGSPLGENNPKWLYDDYVKFIRFAQWRIERTGAGVVGLVTNHGYLDNPTFRGMRRSLMHSFDSLYLLDLHGNAQKHERAPDGTRDENVFDISVGVAVSVLVRSSERNAAESRILHADLWGSRRTAEANPLAGKYAWLLDNSISTTDWHQLEPRSPFYLMVPQDTTHLDEYEAGWRITDAMPIHSNGLITSRDKFVFGFRVDEVADRISDFISSPLEVSRSRYGLRDVREMTLDESKRLVSAMTDPIAAIRPCLYRPFDVRMLFYDRALVRWPTPQVMKHLTVGGNLALVTSRMTKGESFRHVLATRLITEVICLSSKTSNNAFVFPLHLNPEGQLASIQDGASPYGCENGLINFAPEFISQLEDKLGGGSLSTGAHIGAEDVFHYIYAVLEAPSYGARFNAFLKIDFPRIPLTSDEGLFRDLCRLGSRLVMLHLMEANDLASITTYAVAGDNRVEHVHYTEPGQGARQGRVWINSTQYFEGVPPEVWTFHVGGYQVCAKWLKDRRGRQLTYDDLTRYQYIVAALAETTMLMGEIDEVIEAHGGWPIH